MSAVDHETILVTRLWTILEAHTPFSDVVKVGNRIKLYGTKPSPIKIDWSQSANDFPEVTISVPQTSDTLYTLGERYAMGPSAGFNPATMGVACDITFGVVIDVVHRDMNFLNARQLVAEIMTVIRKAGPSLGVSFHVQRVGPCTQSSRIMSGRFGNLGDAGGVRRIGSSINLPVTARLKTSDLLV